MRMSPLKKHKDHKRRPELPEKIFMFSMFFVVKEPFFQRLSPML